MFVLKLKVFFCHQNLSLRSWKWSVSRANKPWSATSKAPCQNVPATTKTRSCSVLPLSYQTPGPPTTPDHKSRTTISLTKENPSSASNPNSGKNRIQRFIDTRRSPVIPTNERLRLDFDTFMYINVHPIVYYSQVFRIKISME